MSFFDPSFLEIINGEFAKGEKIRVGPKSRHKEEMETLFEAFKFLVNIQKPGDKVQMQCTDVYMKNGEVVLCKVFIEQPQPSSSDSNFSRYGKPVV